jgi:hypothetical protein
MGGDFILESLVLPATASDTTVWGLALSCKGNQLPLSWKLRLLTNSPNETVLPHNIPYSLPNLMGRILCEWFPDRRRMWPSSLCFSAFEIEIFLCLGGLANAIPCFVLLSGDHTGNTTSHLPLQLSQGTIINRLHKLLTSLQLESLLFIGQTVQNKPSTHLPFSKIFH